MEDDYKALIWAAGYDACYNVFIEWINLVGQGVPSNVATDIVAKKMPVNPYKK